MNRLELPSLHNESEVMRLSLIGKILSTRNFSASVVKNIANKAWKLNFLVSIRKMDRNLFLFTFEHEADLNAIFQMRPWTFHDAHLVLKTWNPELTWNEVDFSDSGYKCMVSLSCGKTNQASYGLVTNLEKWLRLIYLGSLNQGGLALFASGSKWRSLSRYG